MDNDNYIPDSNLPAQIEQPIFVCTVNRNIYEHNRDKAEKVLIDNGIDPEEVEVVLQAVGYALLDTELYN